MKNKCNNPNYGQIIIFEHLSPVPTEPKNESIYQANCMANLLQTTTFLKSS
jgi:hypothetical protein